MRGVEKGNTYRENHIVFNVLPLFGGLRNAFKSSLLCLGNLYFKNASLCWGLTIIVSCGVGRCGAAWLEAGSPELENHHARCT